MNINNAQHALNTLRKARDLDLRATAAYVRYVKAVANNGTYSGHLRRSEEWANKAAALFLQVEGYLERLT